jgi:hypothetical protein
MVAVLRCRVALMYFVPEARQAYSCFKTSFVQTAGEAEQNMAIPLLDLIARNRQLLSTDPRDKIFALIGLSLERGKPGILGRPDYTLPHHSLARHLVLDTISNSKTLDVLSLVYTKTEAGSTVSNVKYPSWIPDLSDTSAPMTLIKLEETALVYSEIATRLDFPFFTASNNSLCHNIFADDQTLSLTGLHFDTVIAPLGLPMIPWYTTSNDATRTMLNTYISWEQVINYGRTKKYPTGEKVWDVYMQARQGGVIDSRITGTQMQDKNFYRHPLRPYRLLTLRRQINSPALFQRIDKIAQEIIRVQKTVRKLQQKSPISDYPLNNDIIENRRIGKSSKGYICLLPKATQPDDSIVIFKGGKVPFVVRKHEDGCHWRLIGEAYVHGIMFGEAWDESKCEELRIL